MPIYEYRCDECSAEFEELVFGSDPKVKCPRCGSGKTSKKMSAFGMSGVDKPFAGGSSCSSSSCSSKKCSSCG